MNIGDLKVNQKNVEVQGKVTEISPVREFSKFGRVGRVCNATLEDDSGSIQLTLWDDQVDQVKEGNTVKVTGGYVKKWRDIMQLSVSRQGTLEVE